MRRWLLLALALVGGISEAQVSGSVSTADGQAAAYASVMVFADSNTTGKPLAYAITSMEGKFAIRQDTPEGCWLVVRHMGSLEYRQPLRSRTVAVRLEANVQTLDELMVKSTYVPVEVKGDTVAFNTEYFRTGTEETASEVLQRIPGMEVNDNGEVSYGGKQIDKVLIDGKDIFASGSDGALNTLPADAVKGAELLMNYRSGSLIDDFSGRDLTALNVKTDGRARVNGKAGLSAGAMEKARADASLLYIGKTLSVSSSAAANNTGEAVFSIEDYIRNVVGLDNLLSGNSQGLSLSQEEASLLMPPSNVYGSRSGLASVSGQWKPSDKFRMKGNLMLNGTDLEAESLSEVSYYTMGLANRHYALTQNRNLYATGHLQETWKPTEKMEVSFLSQASHSRLHSEDSLSEEGVTDMFSTEDNGMHKTAWREELAINYKTGDGSLLSAHVEVNSESRNFSYGLLTDHRLLPVEAYRLLEGEGYGLDARREIGSTRVAPELTYAVRLSRWLSLNATVGYSYSKNTFGYDDAERQVDESLRWNVVQGALSINKNKGVFRFSVGGEVRSTEWRSTIAGLKDDRQVDWLPQGSVTLAFSNTHRLSLSASMQSTPIEMEYLLRSPMVSGYSSLLGGSAIVNPFARTENVSLNYYIADMFSNTMFFAMAGWSGGDFAVMPHSLQDSSIATYTYYDNDGRTRTRYANASLTKGLGSWPVDAKLSANVNQSESRTTVNGEEGDVGVLGYRVAASLASRSRKMFNFEVGGFYASSQSDYSVGEMNRTLDEFGGSGALMLTHQRWNCELRFSYTRLAQYDRDVYDLGFKAEYKLKNWRFTLRGNNVLNLDKMQWMSVSSTPYYISSSVYRRLPGYVMGGVAYRF